MAINRIRLLNRLLANQIAAGEVVERPASVVKELMENSIDAGATQIDLTVQQGGFHLIKVRDDGHGIDQQDLRLALSRHATSKIATVDDLSYIQTLGFRGEALASIAAVSRFWISSKPLHQAQAWQAHVTGLDTELDLQPTSHPNGTTVMVQDLFFNTPARRKFLRSEKTEYLQIEEVFKRICLSHMSIGFSFTYNHHVVYRLQASSTVAQHQRRIAKIFGRSFLENACYVEMQATDLAIMGWIALPNLSRSQNDLQYVYLNGRLVRDKVINHALRQAYEGLLPTGRHALFILYLTVNPAIVDVNVHPTKHEVRFRQSRLVHDFILYAVRRALQDPQETKISESEEVESAEETSWEKTENPVMSVAEKKETYNVISTPYIETPSENVVAKVETSEVHITRENFSKEYLMRGHLTKQYSIQEPVDKEYFNKEHITKELPKAETRVEEEKTELVLTSPDTFYPTEKKNEHNPWGVPLSLLQKRWLLTETEQGMLIVDTYRAQWNLCVKQLLKVYQTAHLPPQPLLFPHTQTLKKSWVSLLMQERERLEEIGITIDQLGPTTVVVRTLPRMLADLDKNGFLLALTQQLKQYQLDMSDILTLAGHYVIPMALITPMQQQALLEDLHVHFPLNFSDLPNFCDLMDYKELADRVGA